MGLAVDASSHPAHDDEPGRSEVARERSRDRATVRRAGARADERDRRPVEERRVRRSAKEERWRRIVDRGKQRRKAGSRRRIDEIEVTSPRSLRASDTKAPRRRAPARPRAHRRGRRSSEPHARHALDRVPTGAGGRPRSRGAPTQHRSAAAATWSEALARTDTRPRTSSDASASGAASSAARGRGIATARSNRSRRARESFSLYAASRCGEHAHSTAGSPRRRTGTCSSCRRAGNAPGRPRARRRARRRRTRPRAAVAAIPGRSAGTRAARP